SIGAIATSYDFVERHNRLFGIDGHITVNPKTTVNFQALGTNTRSYFYDPDTDQNRYRTGNGLAFYFQATRNTRHTSAQLTGRGWSPDYRSDVGFVSQTNTNAWDLITGYNSEPKPNTKLISWSVSNGLRWQYNWQGKMTYAFEVVGTAFNFK